MNSIDETLKKYIEENILPEYSKNDSGHDINHIKYVTERSLKFAREFPNIDLNMVYVIASFHDIAHHIDHKNHEVLSAQIFYEDEFMKKYFRDNQRIIIKEAIEDHRASLKGEPRSIYGKIVSSADRSTDLDKSLMRIHAYTLKHYTNLNIEEMIGRAYNHSLKKFGTSGYAKVYCHDDDWENYTKEIQKLLDDKYLYYKRYMEVNNIYDVKLLARLFANDAHKEQVRKNEPDKPKILHPINVGHILGCYGYDDNVIAAGYLHDVVEDTKYTIEDISKYFGSDITSLVLSASEPDKSLSWEDRKTHTIETIKNMPLRNKVVVCADKIDNLEDLYLKFEKTGERDFSAFKRGEDKQAWYYKSVYKSLIFNEDENLPIFQRLRDTLDKVFDKKEDLFLRDTIFIHNEEQYNKLRELHARKEELKKLRDLIISPKPYVIEFTGTPRTGKTSTINNLYEFFKKGGFNVSILEEFTTSKLYKEKLKDSLRKLPIDERNIEIMKIVYEQLFNAINSDKDIILADRSINDRQIWNHRLLKKGEIDESTYNEVTEKYAKLSKDLIDYLVITYSSPIEALRRDYLNSLALEPRTFLNTTNLNEYNDSLLALLNLFRESVSSSVFIDTTNMSKNDTSLISAESILPDIRNKYIKSLTKKYNIDE